MSMDADAQDEIVEMRYEKSGVKTVPSGRWVDLGAVAGERHDNV